jgi:hypothetical protein
MEAAIAALAFRKGGGGSGLGASGDTVPAMLTPGEYVISRPAVQRAERAVPGIMHAINNMTIPRNLLVNMMQPPPMPRGYAMGGPVEVKPGGGGFREGVAGGNVTNNDVSLNVSIADLYSQQNVERFLIPVLQRIEKRSR